MRYSEMDLVDGRLVEISFKEINPRVCPHRIFAGEHYRDDGSCKCDDPNETVMAEWGYTWRDGSW
jgi:hypothetical protein